MYFEDMFLDLDSLLDWDKNSYKFKRDEKDMHPYSTYNNKNEFIIVHNILGIEKKDLKLTKILEKGVNYLLIEGKTKDTITGREYSISSKLALDANSLDLNKITPRVKNGLLYISIAFKQEQKDTKINIDIL